MSENTVVKNVGVKYIADDFSWVGGQIEKVETPEGSKTVWIRKIIEDETKKVLQTKRGYFSLPSGRFVFIA